MSERPLEILLVEDSQHDVLIACQAFSRSMVKHRLWVARDGEEAVDFLLHRPPYHTPEKGVRPDLILLDLNLPRLNGFDVLRIVKGHPELRRIPIIVLSTSEREDDISSSYQLGANTFISKPLEFDAFMHVIRLINEYWVKIARLPDFHER